MGKSSYQQKQLIEKWDEVSRLLDEAFLLIKNQAEKRETSLKIEQYKNYQMHNELELARDVLFE